jgi:CRISPR-associated endonuclease/helicase Cas3
VSQTPALPDVIDADANSGGAGGAGGAGVILAWLRRLSDEQRESGDQEVEPRRLVCVLPQRSLVEPLAGQVRGWLAGLALTDQVALYVAGAAREESRGDWRLDMHQPAIVIGTADVLVSKLLLRGYDTGLVMQPIDFGLLTNGAHWILDETRPCPQTAATLRRIAEFTRQWDTAEPFRLTVIRDHFPERSMVLASRPAIPGAVRERHRDGTLTIVVLSTVEASQAVYRDLRGGPTPCVLVHSRFRGVDRTRILALAAGTGDRIAVTTQAAEASLGLAAAAVIGEAPSAAAGPGRQTRIPRIPRVISEEDFLGLFDTLADADVAPYVQDGDDLDVEVAWATWTPGEEGAPDREIRAPSVEYRCRVPLSLIPRLAEDRAVWRFDGDRYARIPDAGERPVRAGHVLLINAADGGYDPELGCDPDARGLVVHSPRLWTPAEQEELAAPETAEDRRWQSLDEHSARVRDQAVALVDVLKPDISPEAARSVVVAGYLHDAGKAHPIWQDALCALAEDEDRPAIESGRPWAKSGGKGGRLEFAGGVSFRHELGSLLLIDGPFRRLLAEAPDEDLVRFGVLAHHGILRMRVSDPEHAEPEHADSEPVESGQRVIRGLVHGATTAIPPMLGQPATRLTVDLAQFGAAGDDDSGDDDGGAWTKTARGLLARYGPFRLAYLETLVRMADWRASAGVDLPVTCTAG